MDISIELPSVHTPTPGTTLREFVLPSLSPNRKVPYKSQPRLLTRFYPPSNPTPHPKLFESDSSQPSKRSNPIFIRSLSPAHRKADKIMELRLEAAKLWKARDMSRMTKDRTTLMWTRKRLERTPRDEDEGNERKGGFSLVGERVVGRHKPRRLLMRQHETVQVELKLPVITNWFEFGKDTPEFDPSIYL